MYPTVAVMMHFVCAFLCSDVPTVDNMTYDCMCSYVAVDLSTEVAKHELCVGAVMRSVADTSIQQCVSLLTSISHHVLASHALKSLCG